MTDVAASRRRQWDAIATPSLANLVIAALVGLLCAAVAFALVMRGPAVYRSSAIMLIDQPVQIARGNEGAVVKLNLLRGKYAALLTTDAVMAPAAESAGVSVGLMRSSQRPTYTSDALTLFPAVEADDPELAQRMAQAAAEALSDYVAEEQVEAGLPPELRLSLDVIQDARRGGQVSPDRTRARQAALAAGAGGLLLGYVLLQLASAQRRRVPTRS